MTVFKKLVNALRNLPISSDVLTSTKIGRGVNSIFKDGIFKNEEIHEKAGQTVTEWKLLVKNKRDENHA